MQLLYTQTFTQQNKALWLVLGLGLGVTIAQLLPAHQMQQHVFAMIV